MFDYFRNCSSNAHQVCFGIQTWHDGRLMMYAMHHFVDLDLDARSQWVGKATNQHRIMIWITKQAKSIKLGTTVGHFYVTLTLKMFIWPDQLV